jgi:hypothetical protein
MERHAEGLSLLRDDADGLVCPQLRRRVFLRHPYIRKQERAQIHNNFSTVVAQQIPKNKGSGNIPPQTFQITTAEMNDYLDANVDSSLFSDASVSTDAKNKLILIHVTLQGGQEATYQGSPRVSNKKIVMQDMKVDNSVADFLMPADEVGKAIESAINDYLADNKTSVLGSVTVTSTGLTLVMRPPQ